MSTFTPGPLPPVEPLALDEPKTLGPLLSSAVRIWLPRPTVFVLTAIVLVVPLELLFLGVLGHGFGRAYGDVDLWASLTWSYGGALIVSALITATHSRAVVALADGKTITGIEAFKLGFSGYGLVLAAAVVYLLAVFAGVIALIVGMFFMSIAGIFTAQIAALERQGPVAALKASYRLVMAVGWWRTLGYVLVAGIVANVFGAIVGGVAGVIALVAGGAGVGAILLIVLAFVHAVTLSFSALITTLLYFSWKARLDAPPAAAGTASASATGGPSFVKP